MPKRQKCNEPHRELDEGHWREFLDRTYVQLETFDQFIANHHVCCKDEKCKELADDIVDKLSELYQLAGSREIEAYRQKKLDAKGDAADRDRG